VRNMLRAGSTDRLRALVLGLSFAAVLGGWVLAAPPGASPDDGYHLGSIWCAAGYKDGLCVEDVGSADDARALVPQPVTALTCFAYDGSISAKCQVAALDISPERLIPSTTNINRSRPNLYYRAMHALIGDGQDVGFAVARIRMANAALTVLLVLLTGLVAEPRLRAAFLLTWLTASVPLGLFLATSVNSSAWGLAGLTTAWANALTVRDHPNTQNRLAAGALMLTGLVMGIGSRTEAVAHIGAIGAAIGVMLLLEHRDRINDQRGRLLGLTTRQFLGGVAGLVVGLAILLALAPRSAGLNGMLEGFRSGYDRLAARDVGDPILAIAFEVPTLWSGALGNVWGLGALDTPIPSLASFPIMGVFIGLVAIGLFQGARARTAAVGVLLLLLFAVPTLSLLRIGLLVYEQLQPRQFMVLLFPLLGLALYRLRGEPPLILRNAGRVSLVAALGLGHSIALLVTIQRHTTGLLPGFLGDPRHVEFGRDVEWWWTWAPHPDIVWLGVSLAYVIAVVGVAQMLAPKRELVS